MSIHELTSRALALLTPREERVLRMRFGVGTDVHSLEEIGRELNMGARYVHVIEMRALQRIVDAFLSKPGTA